MAGTPLPFAKKSAVTRRATAGLDTMELAQSTACVPLTLSKIAVHEWCSSGCELIIATARSYSCCVDRQCGTGFLGGCTSSVVSGPGAL